MDNNTFSEATNETQQAADDVATSAETAKGPTKRIVLAGIGAAATACDSAAERFDDFVSRGHEVRTEWQGKADEVRRQNIGAGGRVRESFRTAMDVFLNGLNVPSKGDVETINVKLNILSRKLDDLHMGRAQGTAQGVAEPPPPPPPPADLST